MRPGAAIRMKEKQANMSTDTPTAFANYVREFAGVEGLQQLTSAATHISASERERFRMRVESRRLHRTRILDVRATPHRGVWDDSTEVRLGTRIALFQFVLSGRAIGNSDGRTTVRDSDSIHVMRTGYPTHYVTEGPLHTTMLWVDHSLLSVAALDAIRRASTFDLRADANARGAEAIVRSVLRMRPDSGSAAAAELEQVLIAQLESAVIAASAGHNDAAAGLYSRMRTVILADPGSDFTTATLAQALGVTESVANRALLAHRTTAAQLTRELRFDLLGAVLRDPAFDGSLADAAGHAGYGGADQAGRAFRDRTGITMSAYRRLVRL